MANELAFALITPYSLMKSRTGGIIGRLLVRSRLDLVGTRMIAPSKELVERYAEMLRRHGDVEGTGIDEGALLSEYVLNTFMPDTKSGKRRRVMLLVFEGDNAVAKINRALGHFHTTIQSAETVRDTFGDLIRDNNDDVVFIEPAAISSPTREKTEEALRLWADMSEADGGIVSDVVDVADGEHVEKTLVMLKPDNFKFASVRPGTIIDIFSGSGLRIVAAKVDRMSVAEALEFYGPVRDVLREKKKAPVGEMATRAVEREMGFQLPAEVEGQLGELLGPVFGDRQFNELVQFMTGIWAPDCPPEERDIPGRARVLALVYAGPDAVARIRNILGPTDPSKAEPGSVRKEYGQDVMVNAAHASDSPENAKREMGIIKVGRDGIQKLIKKHYGNV
jgi:nucleoside diphosphate kinase